MPKPKPNAYYYFMIDFREEQRKVYNIVYRNMQEVNEAAAAHWKAAAPAVRNKYETKAKIEKQKFSGPQHKYTTDGRTYAEIEQEKNEKIEAEEIERADIMNMIQCGREELKDKEFILMDVNVLCAVHKVCLIGECALLKFSIKKGIEACHNIVINAVPIPIGYTSDVKISCQELGLNMPDETLARPNYMEYLATIIDFINKDRSNNLPPIFTLEDKVAPVMSFISQMCRKAGEDECLFRVYKLETLFFQMGNCLKPGSFPKESLVRTMFQKDSFSSTPDICCEHHDGHEREEQCTAARTKRWAYTVLDCCCPWGDVVMEANKHAPANYDLEGISAFQEEKQIRNAPSVAAACVSGLNLGAKPSRPVVNKDDDGFTQVTYKKHTALRLPTGNFGNVAPEAPDIDEEGTTPFAGETPKLGKFVALRSADKNQK
ncbi:protein maelstrom homolog [Bicyclus anynana]|uniref:Protein maelstrom homolog n=1 Tax=Bicyclus anynana TaxID=110368 RepID=A0A6J1NU63_BICAN|nr:protein maelstrom homolog [Bicyclus anynana]